MIIMMMIMMTKYLDPLTTRAARRLGKMYLKHLEDISVSVVTITIITINLVTMITSTCCYPSESLCNGEADKRPGISQLPQR